MATELSITFEDIPQEIIVSKILTLFSTKERQRLRAVCAAWGDTIDNFFGQYIRINNKNSDWLLHSTDVVHVRFTNWNREIGCSCQPIFFTERIHTLEIYSPLTPIYYYNALPLLQSCHNISSLIIGNIIGAYVKDVEDMDYTLEEWSAKYDPNDETWFPDLKTFVFLDDWKTRSETVGSFSQGCCRRKSEFVSFLFKKIRHLTKLSNFKVKLTNSFWWVPLHDLFIVNQEEILENYNSVFVKERPYQSLIQIPLKCLGQTTLHNLESVEIQYQNFLTVQFTFHPGNFGINGIRQLESFRSFISEVAKAGQCPKLDYLRRQEIHALWSEILNTQFCLLQFNGQLTFDTSDHLVPIMKNNASTLQNTAILTLFSMPVDEEEKRLWQDFDFEKFQQQHKLTHLSFIVGQTQEVLGQEGDGENDTQQFITHPFLKHIKSLPHSLVKLEISCPLHLQLVEAGTLSGGLRECLGHLRNLRQFGLWNSQNCLPWLVTNDTDNVRIFKRSHVEALIMTLPKLVILKFNWASNKEYCPCNCCSCSNWTNVEEEDSDASGNIDVEILALQDFSYIDQGQQVRVNKKIRVVTEMNTLNNGLFVPGQMYIYISNMI